MRRFIFLFVLCAALLAPFPSPDAANARAAGSPCAMDQGQEDMTACADFLAYLRDSIQHWSEFASLTIPESTMGQAMARYTPHWDEIDVAYIPESTMNASVDETVDETVVLNQTQESGN